MGFQKPMCQFVSKFVLETKIVPLFTKVSMVDKIETLQYRIWPQKKAISIARQFISQMLKHIKTHLAQYCIVRRNVI